ncbi:DUF1295 domain-containing protein [Skermania piniformis]|uniref:DUF1295 domain-containing protein n=1 Tax=Skermania pinensis TaxID=39122 RepID=UPI00082B519C|nr:DUF1295 domain-containing protein [Skermania piniformis]
MSKRASLARITVAYVVAFGVAATWLAFGPDTEWRWLDALIADLIGTVVVFGFSRAYRNSSCYDAYWSVVPPALTIYWWVSGDLPADDPRGWLMLGVMLVWAVRLTGNWVYSWPGLAHEDWRYPLLRGRAGRAEAAVDLVAIHLVPTLQVFLATVPAYVVVSHGGARGIGWLDIVATVVGLGAVLLEFVADQQMHRFVRRRAPGQVLDRGLWSWSRHPNYFGEFGFWVSMALFGVAAAPADRWWLFAGAAAMLAMFEGASIPMMEQRSLERRPGYRDVIGRVPRFVPRPPRRVAG